jgi:hypothetical protein
MVSSRVPPPATASFPALPASSLSLRPQRPPLHRPAPAPPLLWGFPQRSTLPSPTIEKDLDLDLEFRMPPPPPPGRPAFSAGEIEEVPETPPATPAPRPGAFMVEGEGAARLNSVPTFNAAPGTELGGVKAVQDLQGSFAHAGAASETEASAPWQLVESRRRPRRPALPRPALKPRPPPPTWLLKLCFRCLEPDHRVANCCNQVKCHRCFVFGHRERTCTTETAPSRPPAPSASTTRRRPSPTTSSPVPATRPSNPAAPSWAAIVCAQP